MRPTSIPARMHAMIVAAGPAGMTSEALCTALGATKQTLNQCRVRARVAGFEIHTLFRSIREGGIYFAREDWRDAAAASWQRQVAANARARWAAQSAKRAAKPKMSDEQRKAKKAADKKAYRDKVRAGTHVPKSKPAAELHPIGQHMPSIARNGRRVTQHQATFDRQRQATLKAQAGPVDYSRAVVTVYETPASRYEVVGPVHSVVSPAECREWAKAASGARG